MTSFVYGGQWTLSAVNIHSIFLRLHSIVSMRWDQMLEQVHGWMPKFSASTLSLVVRMFQQGAVYLALAWLVCLNPSFPFTSKLTGVGSPTVATKSMKSLEKSSRYS